MGTTRDVISEDLGVTQTSAKFCLQTQARQIFCTSPTSPLNSSATLHNIAKMHLMFTLDAAGKRIYTLNKVQAGEVTKSYVFLHQSSPMLYHWWSRKENHWLNFSHSSPCFCVGAPEILGGMANFENLEPIQLAFLQMTSAPTPPYLLRICAHWHTDTRDTESRSKSAMGSS